MALPPQALAANAAFENFAKWAEQFSRSSANVIEGQKLAWKRREAMLELIQTDPAQALALAAPFSWRQQLPAQVTRFFEQQLDGRGDYQVAVGTDFTSASTTTYRTVQLGGIKYQAFVYGRRLAQACQTKIPLHGIALDGKMAVSSEPLRKLTHDEAQALAKQRGQALDEFCSVSGNSVTSRSQPVYAESGGGVLCFCGTDHYNFVEHQWILAESGTAGVGDTGVAGVGPPVNDAWTHGTKTLLFMRVNFPDDLTEPVSEARAYSVMDSVNDFYTMVSYDLTALDTTVAPLVTLPQTKAYYSADPGLLLTDARAATKAAGYDTANYDRDIVAFTPVPGYNFGGLAYVGGKGVWLQGVGAGVAAHELGHNYGLLHANLWNTTMNLSSFGPGTNQEYGNIYDTMGSAGAGIYQFDAPHKNQLDWLKADAVQTLTSNGVYRIYPFDVPASSRVPGRYYAAAVQKDGVRYYWLEFRQLFTWNPWTENGLLLNWATGVDSGGSQLIDTTPGSPDAGDSESRDDAAVVIGRTFNDNAAGVHITPLQRGASGTDPWIECQVNLGTFSSSLPPVISLLVDQTNVAVGALVHCYVTASDLNSNTLAYAWSFDDLTFSTNNLPWTAKAFSTTGDHVVRCVVSDMKGGEASANAVVTVGGSGGFRVTGRVTDTNGVPLEGVLVSNGTTDPTQFIGGWTDSDGRYVLVNTGSTNFNLNAYQFGYTFTATTWSNPLQPTNDTPGIDFVGMPLPTVNISVDTNMVAESDGSSHYFTITRTGDTNSDLTVYVVASGTAIYGVNYLMISNLTGISTVDIPPGTNSVTLNFNALDTEGLGSTAVTLSLLDDQNVVSPAYTLAWPASTSITIFDDDAPAQPTVTVAAATPEISENGIDTGEFVFTRIGPTQSALLLNYSVSGSAAPGTDYAPLAGSVIIPAGQSSATVFLQALDDHFVEPNATVTVTISPNAAYALGTQVSDTITILDDGLTTVTVFPTLEPAAEPSSPGSFTIKRDGDLTSALVVNYSVGGTAVPGVDYVPLSGSAAIPAGAASAQVFFTPLDDGLLAPDKYVTLILTNDFNYDVGTPGSANVYITESERPTVSIVVTGTNYISEQGNSFGEFTISRTTTSGDLTVYLAISGTAAPGWNYLPLNNPVTIPNGSSSVTLDLIPFQDAILDPTLTVQLAVLSSTNYNVGSPSIATINILDDGTSQTPSVGFCFSTSQYLESQTPAIAVGLSVTSSLPISVDYKVIGGTAPSSRYSLQQPGTLIISNGLTGLIPLTFNDDTTVEPPQTIQLVLYNPTNATLGAIRVHTCTILDDDLGSISVRATVPNASANGPVPGNFRITRVGSTNASQLVNFQIIGSASPGADYASLGTSATIPAGASYLDLPVVPVPDLAPRLSQTVVLELLSATNCAIVSPNIATVTISDTNASPLPVVTVSSTNQPYAVAGGVNGAFVFTRTGPTNNALTINYTISGTAPASRYVALPTSVTIPAGQTSVTLPVVAVDDHVARGDQTVIVTLLEAETYHPAYPSSATVTVQDSDQLVWIDASIFDASKYGPIPGQFTFSRFGTTNGPVTIYYAISGTASNGVDYVWITNSIVIPAGQLTVTLPIVPLHTGVVRGPATATLTLLTNSAYFRGTPISGTVTIDDDMPELFITTIVSPVLEGSGSNGVFRVTRTGDPKYDFTAYLAAGGTAVYGVDYPPFPTNIYFTCGVTSIDLFVTPSNNVIADGDQTVIASLLPAPAYSILSPSNASLTITDVGTNQTPVVIITNPPTYVAFLDGTNSGLALGATIIDAVPTNDLLTWSEVTGPPGCIFGNSNAANTTVQFTNTGAYLLRLTADNGVLQGHADVLVFVSAGVLSETNILHWTLDDGTGTNVADSSPYGRNGTFSGSPAWITNGAIAGALQFFGTNDCVRQSAGSNTLNGLNAFTVALWVKPADLLDRGFLTADDAYTNATFSLATRQFASCGNATNVVEATFATTTGVAHRASASNALQPGQWQHLALTWTNGEAPKLYINGQLDQPSDSFVAASGVLTNCPQFIIGKGSLDSPASWNGALDDVRVFNVALSADEILALADGPVTNHAPIVNAGTNVTVQICEPVTLIGAVTDDGLPNPPGVTTYVWTYLGTNTDVTIPDPASLTNTFTFCTPGDYTFQLTAFDGQLYSFAQVTVTVIPPTQVDIFADIASAYDMGPVDGDFTITQTGTNALTVYLAISGTASNGVDYVTMTNIVNLPQGSNSVSFPVLPILNYRIKGDQSVVVTILTNLAYSIGNGQATVTIYDSPYGYWSIAHFTLEELTQPELSGAGADFSHDGIVNFAKYAFNLDPKTVNANPPYKWDFENDTNDNLLHFTLTYTRILPPRVVQYGVYVSTDLSNWYTGSNYVQDFYETNDPNGVTETVKTRALMPFPGSTNLFMNIRVWLQQVPQ